MTSANPKKMKVSELRSALESRGLSSNGLKTELIQRLELALDEEEFGSEAQEMEELKVSSPNQTKKPELKKKDAPTDAATMAEENLDVVKKSKTSTSFPVNDTTSPGAKHSPGAINKKEEANEKDVTIADPVSEKKNDGKSKEEESIDNPGTDAIVKSMTEEEKRAARAAKFGIPLSLEDKKAERAKRFHLPSAVAAEENQKRIKRAERFHIETKDTLEKKKQARAERFGLNAEEKRRLERAKRFNLETSESFQEKRQKRLERFATASH